MPVVPKNMSGIGPKHAHHFPLKFITSPAHGTGVTFERKKTLLKDRFNNLLGKFDTEIEAQAEAIRIQNDPTLIDKIINGEI